MIVHVAQAGEQSGRVVLQLTTGHPNRIALEAAVRLAQAFQSEIESLFVEDVQLFDIAGFPFVREVSFSGRHTRALTVESIEQQMRHDASALNRRIFQMARLAEVPARMTVVRDEPIGALVRACSENGPWNVVALGEPLSASSCHAVRRLFEAVNGTTGVVVVGPKAKRTAGPVIAVVEDIAHLESMLRASERLLGVTGENGIVLLLVGEDEEKASWMEGQARLALGPDTNASILRANLARGSSEVLAEELRRMKAGFVLGQFGGLLVPAEGNLGHLTATLECPLFLVR